MQCKTPVGHIRAMHGAHWDTCVHCKAFAEELVCNELILLGLKKIQTSANMWRILHFRTFAEELAWRANSTREIFSLGDAYVLCTQEYCNFIIVPTNIYKRKKNDKATITNFFSPSEFNFFIDYNRLADLALKRNIIILPR